MRTCDPLLTPFSLLSPAAVRLGRLTTNIYDPITAHIDPTYPPELLSVNTITHRLAKHHVNLKSGFGIGGTFILSRIFSFSARASSTATGNLNLDDIEVFRIGNSEDFFRSASTQPRVKNWLSAKSTYAKPVYMITGYAIAGSISGQLVQGKNVTSGTAVQPAQATAMWVDHDPLVVSGSVGSARHVKNETESVERTVCGIMYRKVKFRFLKKTHVMSENDRQWSVNLGTRGAEDGEGTFVVEGELESGDPDTNGVGLVQDLERDGISFKKYCDEEGNEFLVLRDSDENLEDDEGDYEGDDNPTDSEDEWE